MEMIPRPDIVRTLFELTREINPDLDEETLPSPPENATMEELGIVSDPMGHGELLNLKHAIEQQFGIRFTQAELPDFFESGNLTLAEVADAVVSKLEKLFQVP